MTATTTAIKAARKKGGMKGMNEGRNKMNERRHTTG